MITSWIRADCSVWVPAEMSAAVEHVAMAHYERQPAVVEVLVENSGTVRFRGRKLDQP